MAGCGDGTSAWGILKVTWVTFVLIVSLFLFVGIKVNGEIEGCTSAKSSSPSNHKHTESLWRVKLSVPAKHNPYYVSKRRVPSGPDPIHNRHVGDNRRPPGGA